MPRRLAQGVWRESNPHLLLHRQACRNRYTTDTDDKDVRSRQWTAGELNPDLRRAIPASSRWTSSPSERKARELNPHPPKENRLSRAARPTVSGYLPEVVKAGVGVEPTSGGLTVRCLAARLPCRLSSPTRARTWIWALTAPHPTD